MSLASMIRCDLGLPVTTANAGRSRQVATRGGVSRCRPVQCRAQQQGPEDSGSGSSGTDWDAAWQRYQKARAAGSGSPRSAATRTILPNNSVRMDPSQRQAQDTIRRDEGLLLNLWASQGFQAFLALSLLAVFVAFAGPPPVDDRCTLPWC